MRALGHTVVALQENTTDLDTVARLCEAGGVELFLWTRTWEVDTPAALRMLSSLRRAGIPSVSFHLDRFHGLEREPLIAQEPFFKTDWLFSPDDGPWAEYGVNHVWMPPGVYHAECGEVARQPKRWPWEVVFVGSHPYPHREWEPVRTRVLRAFGDHFGARFAILPRRGHPLRGLQLQSLYATVPVVLGDSCLVGDPYRYWSDRVPETLGRGGCLIHPNVHGMEQWYEDGYDLATYDTPHPADALAQAIRLLRDRDLRDTIAAKGRATVLARDTYMHRMTTVLDVVCSG